MFAGAEGFASDDAPTITPTNPAKAKVNHPHRTLLRGCYATKPFRLSRARPLPVHYGTANLWRHGDGWRLTALRVCVTVLDCAAGAVVLPYAFLRRDQFVASLYFANLLAMAVLVAQFQQR